MLKKYLNSNNFIIIFLAIVMVVSFLFNIEKNRAYVNTVNKKIVIPEFCPVKHLLGIKCPTCGLSRGIISISHLQFKEAWQYNKASYIIYFLIIFYLIFQILHFFFKFKKNKVVNVERICINSAIFLLIFIRFLDFIIKGT